MGTVARMRTHHICRFESAAKPQRNIGWISNNWSGYSIKGAKGAFRRISGEWNVPFLRPSGGSSYSSAWIGIDGFGNQSLIQTGTGHDLINGKPYYYAWWEILPAAATLIPLPVRPGDRMSAVIAKKRGSTWIICLRNVTKGWTFRISRRYRGPQTSAEWIVEAPLVGGILSRMARLSDVAFSQCRVNGSNPKLKARHGGLMLQNLTITAIPSDPSPCGDAFVVKSTLR
ncbi:hypothetical protein J31TS3_06590 [Paenibacillus lactis]|nr:hypothetical protein J31TS3_06590 [Paenibacillus lactis]